MSEASSITVFLADDNLIVREGVRALLEVEDDQLARAVREVASGGSMLDPTIVEALTRPVTDQGDLTAPEQTLLTGIAQGRTIKALAHAQQTAPPPWPRRSSGCSSPSPTDSRRATPAASTGCAPCTRPSSTVRSRASRCLACCPGGVADLLHAQGRRVGQTDELEVTVLMSDIRGSTTIAQATNPRVLAGQLNEHRAAMNRAIVEHGGTVMQFVGEAVNLTQRLQQWADPGETVLSDATLQALTTPIDTETLEPALVKGRQTPVTAHRHPPRTAPVAAP